MRNIGGHIISLVISALLLSGVYGCKDSEEEILSVEKPTPMPAVLELDITLSAPAEGSDVPDREQIKELRLIMVDKETDKVDFNEKLDVSRLNQHSGTIRYTYKLEELKTTTGTKVLYALANAEALIADIVHTNSGVVIIDSLRDRKIGKGFFDNPQNAIPIISKPYELELKGEGSGQLVNGVYTFRKDIKMQMVYAAVKFDFTFVLDESLVAQNKEIDILKWDVSAVAKESYLVPHMENDAWKKLVQLAGLENPGGTGDDSQWVTDYTIPEGILPGAYEKKYEPGIHHLSATQPESVDGATYYMHESKSLWNPTEGSITIPNEQRYSLTVGIKERGDEILLSKEFPNLKSLVRGTHVKVRAIIKEIPGSGDNSLEVRVKTWEEKPPVDGDWEEM